MITSHDVAKLAKVSQTTVSRAFRDDCYIHPETRKKVLEAAEKLGYFPNYSAKSLKKKQSKIIGLLLSNYNNKFYTKITQSVESHMTDNGYRLMLTFSDEKPDKERKYLESFISSRVDGLIFIPVSRKNEDLVKAMAGFDIKVLQFTRNLYDYLDAFFIDDEFGTYMATKYLLNMGHSRILIIESEVNRESSLKIAGYRRAMEEAGAECVPGCVLYLDTDADTASLIAYAASDLRPTAVISSSSMFTLSALKACQCLNLKIPDDISFISYDDNEWLDFMHIDAVAHPMDEIGENISDFLLEMINSKDDPETHAPVVRMIKPHLVVRNSVKRLTAPS